MHLLTLGKNPTAKDILDRSDELTDDRYHQIIISAAYEVVDQGRGNFYYASQQMNGTTVWCAIDGSECIEVPCCI